MTERTDLAGRVVAALAKLVLPNCSMALSGPRLTARR
jgi:hypothetical protein